jgi:hypothetical protein
MEADGPLPPKMSIEITDDLCDLRQLLMSAVDALNKSPQKSRARALVVTKLEEAFMWAGEALRTD